LVCLPKFTDFIPFLNRYSTTNPAAKTLFLFVNGCQVIPAGFSQMFSFVSVVFMQYKLRPKAEHPSSKQRKAKTQPKPLPERPVLNPSKKGPVLLADKGLSLPKTFRSLTLQKVCSF
jgi:hypothetical protein